MFNKSKQLFTKVNSVRHTAAVTPLMTFRATQHQQAQFTQGNANLARFSTSNRNSGNGNNGRGFMFGSMLAVGGLTAAALYLQQKTQEQVAEAGSGVTEVKIPFADKLGEGEMKMLKVGEADDQKVLVARYQDKLYSTGNYCSHFGVPLNNGMLFDDKVLCPAHAAGFSIITGKPENAPGLDGIPSFPVVEKNGEFFVQIPQDGLPRKVPMPLTKRDPENKEHYVIVGGGAAGLNCAETLRQSGFSGQITMVSKEKSLPYDRTLLSKALATGNAEKFTLRDDDFFKNADIDTICQESGFKIKADEKKLITNGGKKIIYDKLLIATGSHSWVPPVPGVNMKNVLTLRTADDHKKIKEACENAKNIVVIGASFIGSECAASLKMHYKDAVNIQIINGDQVPFQLPLGREIGEFYQKEHEDNGVKITNGVMLKTFNRKDGEEAMPEKLATCKSVTLSDGTTIDADIVIMGTGVRPNTKWLANSGIEMDRFGGIVCDPFMQTNLPDIYAAGDIASIPYWPTGGRTRIEHWVVALEQGTNAGFNMLGKFVPYSGIPFFWTRQYNRSLQFIGNNAVGYKEVVIRGKMNKHKFLAYYINENDQVVAVAGMGKPKQMLTLLTAMEQNVMPTGTMIKSRRENPKTIKLKLKANSGAGKCKRANCCMKKNTTTASAPIVEAAQ